MPIHWSIRATALALVGAAVGCRAGSDRQLGSGNAVTLARGTGPTISSSAVQRFSLPVAGPGPHEFTDLRGVLVAEDGSVGAVDAGCPCAFEFSPAGRLLATIGRAGSGPGEFREPTLVAFWGDSLAVFD